MTRLATGLALAALSLLVIKRLPAGAIWLAATVIALIALDELRRILARAGRAPWPEVAFPGTLALLASFVAAERALAPVTAAIIALALARALVPTQAPPEGIDRALGTIAATLFVGFSFGHIVALFPPGSPPALRERGEDLLVLLLGVVYFGDTFALYAGKSLGRRKIAPGISPGKTWEGAVFGVAGGIGFALLAHVWFFRRLPLAHALVLGFTLGVVAIAGDLVESLMKRAAAVKDSGALLPGHGGVLDRVDSLLLAAPVVFWYDRLVLGPP